MNIRYDMFILSKTEEITTILYQFFIIFVPFLRANFAPKYKQNCVFLPYFDIFWGKYNTQLVPKKIWLNLLLETCAKWHNACRIGLRFPLILLNIQHYPTRPSPTLSRFISNLTGPSKFCANYLHYILKRLTNSYWDKIPFTTSEALKRNGL